MIKLIIFDLDGTLLDTSGDIHATLNATLKKFGVPEVPLETTLKCVGNGARKLIERVLGEKYAYLCEEVYGDYFVNFAECDNALTTLYGYEKEALGNFKKAGVRLAVVTNKPQRAADKVCSQLLSGFDFDFIIGQRDGVALKPDPAATLEIIKKSRIGKQECVFVGDGETDVITAKNAGIVCISALWGYRKKEELEKAGGTLFAENYRELEKLILKA